MLDSFHFLVFVLVSLFAFVFILMFALRDKMNSLSFFKISFVALIVVVGGMFFAKYGANIGLPCWIYYCVPALLTLFLPPVMFVMNRKELVIYLIMALLVAPLIHLLFSFFLGWKEYMPFIRIPSLWELLK